jgi:hypothetical protein
MNYESLEQQTAPESTRGLFDDDENQVKKKAHTSIYSFPSNMQDIQETFFQTE